MVTTVEKPSTTLHDMLDDWMDDPYPDYKETVRLHRSIHQHDKAWQIREGLMLLRVRQIWFESKESVGWTTYLWQCHIDPSKASRRNTIAKQFIGWRKLGDFGKYNNHVPEDVILKAYKDLKCCNLQDFIEYLVRDKPEEYLGKDGKRYNPLDNVDKKKPNRLTGLLSTFVKTLNPIYKKIDRDEIAELRNSATIIIDNLQKFLDWLNEVENAQAGND